jgi:hypothetical protein
LQTAGFGCRGNSPAQNAAARLVALINGTVPVAGWKMPAQPEVFFYL